MKIDNNGKPTYGPRSQRQDTEPSSGSNWLFWVGVAALVIVVVLAL